MNDNYDQDIADQVRGILGVQRVDFEAKYLGLPTRGCSNHWRSAFTKEWWHGMRAAGKEVLIKPVAQALPNYVMSVFKLPLTQCDDLMKHIRAFWWGAYQGKRKVQWLP